MKTKKKKKPRDKKLRKGRGVRVAVGVPVIGPTTPIGIIFDGPHTAIEIDTISAAEDLALWLTNFAKWRRAERSSQ